MTATDHFDVVIIGAGPAGSVLAAQLSRKGYRVAVVDRERFPRYAIGETLTASVAQLLKRTGILPANFALAGSPTTGNLSAWGSTRLTFHAHTENAASRGLQVERARFDAQLLAAARLAGTIFFEGLRLEEFEHRESNWRVRLRSALGATQELRTSFLCDASGRARVLARRLRLPQRNLTRQVGLVGYWRSAEENDDSDGFNALVESLPDGWFYTARLNPTLRVAGFMTDRNLLPSNLRKVAPQIYLKAMERTKHSRLRLHGFVWDRELRIFPTYPSLIERCCGTDWVLVGDAASTLDPLCSQGVQKAIASALTAATAVHTLLVHQERSEAVAEFCREREHAGFLGHLAARSNYYAREHRFADTPFWRERATREVPGGTRTLGYATTVHPQDRIAAGMDVQLAERPVIEGEFVEKRSVVIVPEAVRGLRYCGDVCVPDLIQLLSDRPSFNTLWSRYRRLHPDISIPSFRRGIAGLHERRVLKTGDAPEYLATYEKRDC